MNLQKLSTPAEADALIDGDRPAWIYKESDACPISKNAMNGLKGYMLDHPDEPVGHIVVQDQRDVSEHVTQRLGVKHQTPQIILVQGGKALWNASHFKVTSHAMVDGRNRALDAATD